MWIPKISLTEFFTHPWSDLYVQDSIWIVIMGFFVVASCGLLGTFLVLKGLSFLGDAMSHSVLPGIVIAFLLTGSKGIVPMLLGATISAIITNLAVDFFNKNSKLKSDAAIGLTFTTLFALGVVLVASYTDKIDLDQECVLYGELAFISYQEPIELIKNIFVPLPVLRMFAVFILTCIGITIFYKQLLVTTFDSILAKTVGMKAKLIHYILMVCVAIVIVFSFESVGAILVVAMLVFPCVTALLFVERLNHVLYLGVFFSLLYVLGGLHLSIWLNASVAAAMVVTALMLFILAWIIAPEKGLITLIFRRLRPKTSSS